MERVQRGSFKLILPFFDLEVSVLLADDVHLADHLVVIDEVIRVDVQGVDVSVAFALTDALLELSLSICGPGIFQI